MDLFFYSMTKDATDSLVEVFVTDKKSMYSRSNSILLKENQRICIKMTEIGMSKIYKRRTNLQ